MKFNEKIKNIRINSNLTQEEMAKKLYVSRSTIAKWEQDRGLPSVDLLYKISETFNIKIDDLLNNEDIRFIEIENNKNINKLKRDKFFYFSIIFVLLLSLLSFTLYYYNDKNNENNSSISLNNDNLKKINARIIDINESENIIELSLSQNIKNIEYDYINFLKITTYDIAGNTIEEPKYKIGYHLELSFDNNSQYNNINSIKKIIIIETNIEEKYIYGFFLSTSIVDIIPTQSPEGDYDTSYQYKENTYFGSSFIFPWCTNSGVRLNRDFVVKREYLKSKFFKNLTYKQEIYYSIDIDDSLEVYVYALDNSETGFFLHSTVIPANNKIILNGTYINERSKQETIEKNTNNRYSIDLEFHININFVASNYFINIYEYNKNHEIIKETKLVSYEDFYLLNVDFFKVNNETLYYIIEENSRLGKKSKICSRGEFTKVSLPLKYGYVQSFIIGG